jgi:hypothetical protein
MLLAPWVLGRPPGETIELGFVLATVVIGVILMYLFGRFWQG